MLIGFNRCFVRKIYLYFLQSVSRITNNINKLYYMLTEFELPISLNVPHGCVICITYKKIIGYGENGPIYMGDVKQYYPTNGDCNVFQET